MQFGVNTVLFAGYDLRTAMERIKQAGYDAAELSAIEGMCEHLRLDTWKRQAGEIRALSEDIGLPFSAMEEAALNERRLMMAFEAAVELGIPVVNVGPGGSKDSPEDLPRVIGLLTQLAEEAELFGVTLCVKAHVGAAVWNTATTLRATSEIDSPAFGIDMDPSHVHRAGEVPKEALKQVVSRVRHVHIRDCAGPGPSPGAPELQACGRGDIDLLGYIRVLAEAGYDGPVNLEVIGANDYELEQCSIIAAESRGFLNAALRAIKT